MKFKTFRNSVFIGGFAILVGGVLIFSKSCSSDPIEPQPKAPAPTQLASATPNATPATPPAPTKTAVSTDEIMKLFETPSDGKTKLKDAFPESSSKVNLYDDKSTGKWIRAKIDYDRDEKDDEVWFREIETGKIFRKISPTDDGTTYAPSEKWNGTAFMPKK